MEKVKRKGWRRQPDYDGGLRMPRSWRNAKLGVRVVERGADSWYYYGGAVGNSLWNGYSYRTPLEAMVAAEAAQAQREGGA